MMKDLMSVLGCTAPGGYYQTINSINTYFGRISDKLIYAHPRPSDKSTVVLAPAASGELVSEGRYEFKDWGEVSVTITPNANLKTEFPQAIVEIDGNSYDLGILANPVKFSFYSGDHRIDIRWSDSVIESFRFIRSY